MPNSLSWGQPSLTLEFSWDVDAPVTLVGATSKEVVFKTSNPMPVVEILTPGSGRIPASSRLAHTALGQLLRYVSHEASESAFGPALQIMMGSGPLEVLLRLEMPHGGGAVRSTVTLTNSSHADVVLQAVTSWSAGFGDAAAGTDPLTDWEVTSGVNDWLGEGRWDTQPLRGPGFVRLAQELTGHNPRGSMSRVSTGSWSTGHHLPVAALHSASAGVAWAWQIEHNGAWRWEIGEDTAGGYLALSGPTERDSAWTKVLRPGESFVSVPATVALGADLTDVVAALTAFRRSARRDHDDNRNLPVVFNDYMNTLDGDPTTEKLLPLIHAAAAVGAEIFCIDAGWYDDTGYWWDGVGEWLPSTTRFPNGLREVIAEIRKLGMVPGLWLEPEVIGLRSPVADRLPHEAFLSRHGERIVEHGRYHLDLRHPAAVNHLNEVVDRLVAEFGVGFFKFDYNIDPGSGTDVNADSPGDGLLGHNRAHLAWLDSVLDRHPDLVIENCSSGAMRMDFALLSRLAMQSTSDQQDFLKYPSIAASAPLSMLPEQAASWAYPQPGMSLEEVSFCLATGLLGRFYLSGYLNNMEEAQLDLVREAVRLAKALRVEIPTSHPFWPAGLPGWTDGWVALGLSAPERDLVTVWNRDGETETQLSLPHLAGSSITVSAVFPSALPEWTTVWNPDTATLTVRCQPGVSARILEITSTVEA